ncbi:MAG: prephenate dehydrogenase/arogenate dehydrogenase family protein [Acidimicrobiales bacterium]|jgi:prephenate dehydrogenase|nr:prephenate dehydrogenase/arogenate dehydrogenase family protein [Acidimicrobiales bacterium]
MSSEDPRRAQVVGIGLIGGSIGLALRAQGWHVTGRDRDPARTERARELGCLDAVGHDPGAEVTFVATTVGEIPVEVRAALADTRGLVTDVGSVKSPMLDLMVDPRYVGGHPMAGSELEGLDGARSDLFEGATWVLTPVAGTDDEAYTTIRGIVSSFGADVVAVSPERHDSMVAVVSHVPHLTAATLMRLADRRSEEHRALLRLAAGGFRDMTRIAAGHPGIWPDICAENRDAILEELDGLIRSLSEVRETVATGDRAALVAQLEQARTARMALPARWSRPQSLAEVRVPIPDRKGVIAEITRLATELDVSIVDIEIAHSAERPQGVLILVVEATLGERLQGGLMAQGFRPSLRTLG